jgi:hypothetical protein
MTTNDNQKNIKNISDFSCKKCNFICCKKGDWNRHIATAKHQKTTENNEKLHICKKCETTFKDRAGLWRHNKKCIKNTSDDEFVLDKEFVMMVLKQHSELIKTTQDVVKENTELKNLIIDTQTQMIEAIKTGSQTINNNSHNKTFNLNFFLNDTCKDAMNIMDFVNSVKLQLTDLEKMGDVGFVNGMSNIIIRNLKSMDVSVRPIHCTDTKREVLYIKDENKWDKESAGNPKIRKAIKYIAQKNSKQLSSFKDKYPDCTKSHSKYSDTYNKLLVEVMGGNGDNDEEKENKIISKVVKEIIVDK